MRQVIVPIIILAALGLGIGAFNAGNPNSEHWAMIPFAENAASALDPMMSLSSSQIGEDETLFFLPLSFGIQLFGAIFDHYGFGNPALAFIKGGLLSFYLAAAFIMFISLGLERVKSFAACILSALCPPVVYSTWKIPEEETMLAAGLFFLAAAAFQSSGRNAGIARRAALAAAAVVFSAAAILLKDTMKAFVPAFFIFLLFFIHRSRSDAHRRQYAAAAFVVVFTAVVFIAMKQPSMQASFMARIGPEGITLAAYHFLKTFFSGMNALVQFSFCFHAAGAVAIYSAFRARPGPGVAGFILLALLFLFPPFFTFHYHGMIVYPTVPAILTAAAGVFCIIGLVRLIIEGPFPLDAFGAALLWSMLAVFLVTALFPFMRDDASPRHFIPVVPFLAFIVVEALFRLRRLRVRYLLIASIAFFIGAYFYNTSREFRDYNTAELAAKKALAARDLSDSLVLYNNEFSPVFRTDLSVLGAADGQLEDSRFMLFEPYKNQDGPDTLHDEICMKALGLTWQMIYEDMGDNRIDVSLAFPGRETMSPKNNMYFYEVYSVARSPGLRGAGIWTNFMLHKSFGPRVLSDSEIMASRGYWQHGAATILRNYYTGRKTDLAGMDVKSLFEESVKYSLVSPWLESLPIMIIKGIPVFQQVEARAGISATTEKAMGCRANIDRYIGLIESTREGLGKPGR